MTSSNTSPFRVAIVGGGITGLAAAYRLTEICPTANVTVFEASEYLGGVLRTERRDGFLIERSADMFTTREPWAMDLCRRIGFTDNLIRTNDAFRKAFVVRRGRLIPVPEGFTLMSPARIWPVVRTPLLSPLGKLRLAYEFFVAQKNNDADESLESFALRRFGREAYERLIQPLIGGIYTADPKLLSMAATMSQFVDMERQHGSLIRGMRRAAAQSQTAAATTARGAQADKETGSGARYGLFVAPRDGMSSFIAALAAKLPAGSIRLHSPVTRLQQREDRRWELQNGDQAAAEVFDAVIVATPGYRAATLLQPVDRELSDLIGRVPHAGAAVVVAAFKRAQFQHPLDGFGFVVPAIEDRKILAGSFASVKFAGRAPDDSVLTRTFVGGALQPQFMERSDNELQAMVFAELQELLGLRGAPLFANVVRWAGTMPQYHVGHLQLVDQIEQRATTLANFALAGNFLRGVGIPFCVRSGELAAERIASGTRL